MNAMVRVIIGSTLVILCGTLQADWMVGDVHKMHFPQLPDPVGWDIKVSQNNFVADDFLCTQSGPITDIHFWGSWRGDVFVDPLLDLQNIQLTIYPDVPAGVDLPYSHPESFFLWQYQTSDHDPALVSIRNELPSPQGWYDPQQGLVLPGDHSEYFQYNVSIDPNAQFIQQEGTIYWLEIHVITTEGLEFGWKTSLDAWNDDSVSFLPPADLWEELFDPLTGTSLQQAFVIVPEPGLAALVLGFLAAGLVLLKRRLR
ncbi:hypothetical protein G0Q06_03510 [Puniceicoccales bacterium CK1056]|uniref:DUF7901 domain-containing protein n=1 Tax=Oceanipulchritudo coccoides TaxID=2706888 RepID=A0A6B2LY26_9BACT|nr:hypothetical protein [Oceanipulchritudo coccoides]NDV61511.1 hypothetical protein [Oceanipulchritudo coccoides]